MKWIRNLFGSSRKPQKDEVITFRGGTIATEQKTAEEHFTEDGISAKYVRRYSHDKHIWNINGMEILAAGILEAQQIYSKRKYGRSIR